MEAGLSENTITYLEARCQKPHNREKIGSPIFDEIYTVKRCEFSRSNGQVHGMTNANKETAPSMFKSVASKYVDVVAVVLLTNMDSSNLHKLFNDVMNTITTIGYDVVVSLVDRHFSNVKFYEKELRADNPTSFICHPLDQHRFLDLLYDTTHIFKCIYNNFQKHVFFLNAQSLES